jgi:nitrite reductase/ring-hydroxylating ferredoxin subunit
MTYELPVMSGFPRIDPKLVLPVGLPMPANPGLLEPGAARVRVRSRTNRFPFPIPNGWFAVALAAEIEPGQIRPVHYFGEDLVVYRTAGGEPRTVEAYCRHLGAHLAVGGRVDGECVVCPFHGWTYDGTGQCVKIPYAQSERIPAKARLRTYPTIERNGMIWAWHHLEEGEPFYEVPVVSEVEDSEWQEPLVREFYVATSCQEMAENHHDLAHVKSVHGVDATPKTAERVEGEYLYTEWGSGVQEEAAGLGLDVMRVRGIMTYFSCVTPIDDDTVQIRWVFTAPTSRGSEKLRSFVDIAMTGMSQDVPIWENKVYRERPMLTKGESDIAQFRGWCRQFYSLTDELIREPSRTATSDHGSAEVR